MYQIKLILYQVSGDVSPTASQGSLEGATLREYRFIHSQNR